MPPGLDVLDQGIVSVGEREVGKLVLSANSDTVRAHARSSTSCRTATRFWNVTYTTDADEFVDRYTDLGAEHSQLATG